MKMAKPIKFSNLKKSQKVKVFSNLEEYQQSWDFDFFKFLKNMQKCENFTKWKISWQDMDGTKMKNRKLKFRQKCEIFNFDHFDILTFLKMNVPFKVNLMFFATLHILGRKHV